MVKRKTLATVRGISVTALAIVAYVVLPAAMVSGTTADRALAWTRSHTGALPTTPRAVALYPAAYQKWIVASLTPEQKAAFWHEYLAGKAEDSRLSDDQRSYLRQVVSALTTKYFETGEADARLNALLKESGARLGAQRNVLSPNGFVQGTDRVVGAELRQSVMALRVRMTERLSTLATAEAGLMLMQGCNCNALDQDYCSWRHDGTIACCPNPDQFPVCQGSSWGCGFFGIAPCSGVCC
jgi:hypothetical protein